VANYRVRTDKQQQQYDTQDETEETKSYRLRLFIPDPEFLKVSVDLQTAFAAETY
jgi:hypothetical protein